MKKKNKKIIPFIVLASVTVVAAIFVISQLFTDLRVSAEEYLEKREEFHKLELKERELKDEDLDLILDRKNVLKELFGDPERPIGEIIFLEEKAGENNLEHEVSVGEEGFRDGWGYTRFEISVSGQLSSILDFLNKLKRDERVLFIDEFNFDFKEYDHEDPLQSSVDTEIILEIYNLEN